MKTGLITSPPRKLRLMNEVLSIALRENTDELLRELSRFDYNGFNHHPKEKAWSPGEIAEHLLLADLRTFKVLSGNSISSDRDPQELVTTFTTRLADRKNTIDAPQPLIPSLTIKDPEATRNKIAIQRKQLLLLVEEKDLTQLLPDTPHRLYGIMSGIEWIQFTILHCQRHLLQLKEY